MRTQQVVFWIEQRENEAVPRCRCFGDNGLVAALNFANLLRRAAITQTTVVDDEEQNHGPNVSHICIAGDTPGNTTLAGVESPSADYAWKKRRR